MRCDKHRKDCEVPCTWCGKQLCPMCVAREVGKKAYCEKCHVVLGGVAPKSYTPMLKAKIQ